MIVNLKKRIFTLAERQRLIESITMVSGVCGAFFGVILYKSIFGGVIWSIGNSFLGGSVGLFIVHFIGGKRIINYRRNKLEREASTLLSALGSILIGSAMGGAMGGMMNLRHFSLIYGTRIESGFINIVDGTLMGGIGGTIGALIGTFLAETNALVLEWQKRRHLKKEIRLSEKEEANVS